MKEEIKSLNLGLYNECSIEELEERLELAKFCLFDGCQQDDSWICLINW